jgi:hypothetical protein
VPSGRSRVDRKSGCAVTVDLGVHEMLYLRERVSQVFNRAYKDHALEPRVLVTGCLHVLEYAKDAKHHGHLFKRDKNDHENPMANNGVVTVPKPCSRCKGSRRVIRIRHTDDLWEGSGFSYGPCRMCRGNGVVGPVELAGRHTWPDPGETT